MAIKTVGLETAKALKDAGFRQDSYFWYEENPRPLEQRTDSELPHILFVNKSPGIGKVYAAPTSDELLEEIVKIEYVSAGFPAFMMFYGLNGQWNVCFRNPPLSWTQKGSQEVGIHKELPEALAKMYLFLVKEGLLKKGKV
jgi:hypothetical protein